MFRTRDFVLGMLAGGLVLGAGMLLGAATVGRQDQDSLRLRRLEIVDADGLVQFVVQSTPDGGSARLNDRRGRPMVRLGAGDHGGMIHCLDTGGHPAARLALDEHGGGLVLAGRSGKDLVHLSVSSQQHGAISCLDPYGMELVSLFGDVNGAGAIETYAADGERLVSLKSADGRLGQIESYNGRGRVQVRIGSAARDVGRVETFDVEGRPMILLGAHANGPALRLFGENGRPLLTLESDDRDGGEIGIWHDDGEGRVLRPE